MAPEIARPPLTEQPWLKEFLETRGFERTVPASFTNDRATVRLGGNVLVAIPGDGTKAWRTELKDVLTRLPAMTNHQVPEITPANWGRSRPVPRTLAA